MSAKVRITKEKPKHTVKWHLPKPRKAKPGSRSFADDIVVRDRPNFHYTRDNR